MSQGEQEEIGDYFNGWNTALNCLTDAGGSLPVREQVPGVIN